jgi:hypothetical protein
MADPDWIGPPVESAWWSWDGKRAYFPLKRQGSSLRDLYAVDVSGGAPMTRIADSERAGLDAINPVYDSARHRSAFVRNGDVFVRDLASGAFMQLTRGVDAAADPEFAAGDSGLIWHVGDTWYRYRFDQRVTETVVALKAEKDPHAPPGKNDPMRDAQLRLFDTLRKDKEERDAQRAHDRQLRSVDPTRAPAPLYLGDDVAILATSLSPDGRWLIAVVAPKGADAGRVGKLQKFVTESGYEEQEDERTRVGRNSPAGQTFKLIDLRDGTVSNLSVDALPGIDADPLAAMRKAAGKDALKGHRPLRMAGIQWAGDGRAVALMLNSADNKDRWIATVDFAAKSLRSAQRSSDPAWINTFAFNEFGWLPDNRTLWLLSEQSGW